MKATVTRRTMAFAVLAATAIGLAACGTGSTEPEPETSDDAAAAADGFDGKEIAAWFPGANQAEIDLVNDQIVPDFEAETGASVEVTFVDWGDLSPKLNTAFAAGTAPDVFGHGPAAVPDFVTNDRIESLDDYVAGLDQADRDDLAAALPGGQVDGTQYLVPLTMEGTLLMYNAADLEAAGLDPDSPPSTWEDVRAAAETMTERDGDTVTHAGLLLPSNAIGNEQTFASLTYGGGGDLVADGAMAVDSPEGQQALQYFVDVYQGDNAVGSMLGEDYTNLPPAQQPLITGDASMAILPAHMMQQVYEARGDLDLRPAAPLQFEGGTPAMFGGAGPGLMINSDSAEKDLAWAFIEYLIDAETSLEYASGIGAVPTRASAAESDYVQGSPVMQAFVAAAPSLRPNPNIPGWVAIRDEMMKHLDQALYGQVSVDDALSAMTEAVVPIIAENS